MKHINFIKALPAKAQKEIDQWLTRSSICIGLILCIEFGYTLTQIIQLIQSKSSSTYTDQQQIEKLTHTISLIQQTDELLETKINKLRAYSNKADLSATILTRIAQIIPPTIQLLDIKMDRKKQIIIQGIAFHSHEITRFAKELKGHGIGTRVTIDSLQPYLQHDPTPLLEFTLTAHVAKATPPAKLI